MNNLDILKEILLKYQFQYLSWGSIHYLFNEKEHKLGRRTQTPKNFIRQQLFKELQSDYKWIKENGVPITKNSKGVKLSDKLEEINNYLDGEHKRALAILGKLKPIKEHRDRLLTLKWTEQTRDL